MDFFHDAWQSGMTVIGVLCISTGLMYALWWFLLRDNGAPRPPNHWTHRPWVLAACVALSVGLSVLFWGVNMRGLVR